MYVYLFRRTQFTFKDKKKQKDEMENRKSEVIIKFICSSLVYDINRDNNDIKTAVRQGVLATKGFLFYKVGQVRNKLQ